MDTPKAELIYSHRGIFEIEQNVDGGGKVAAVDGSMILEVRRGGENIKIRIEHQADSLLVIEADGSVTIGTVDGLLKWRSGGAVGVIDKRTAENEPTDTTPPSASSSPMSYG